MEVFIPEVNCYEFSKVVSWLAWNWYFICKVNSTNGLLLLKNTLFTLCLRSWGFHAMPFVIVISCKVSVLWSCFKSGSWRRCAYTNVLLVCEREMGELVQPSGMWGLPWDLLCWASGIKYLCMVPCHSCHTFMGFGQAGTKRCGGCLKIISWGWRCKSQKGGSFHRESRFSLCNTAVLWNFIASLTGYIL